MSYLSELKAIDDKIVRAAKVWKRCYDRHKSANPYNGKTQEDFWESFDDLSSAERELAQLVDKRDDM